MNLHDWSTVGDGAFHQFHNAWITMLCVRLNRGGLPPGYGAYAERSMSVEDDVPGSGPTSVGLSDVNVDRRTGRPGGGTATLEAEPAVTSVIEEAVEDEVAELYVRRQDRLAVRDRERRVVAVVEIVSVGNKDSRDRFEAFLAKSAEVIDGGAHLTVVDVHRPLGRDPRGTVDAVWERVGGRTTRLEGRSVGTIRFGRPLRLYAESLTIGEAVPSVPLFLGANGHVPLPLAEGYADAWSSMAVDEQDEIEAATAAAVGGG